MLKEDLYGACGEQKFGLFAYSTILEMVAERKVLATDLLASEGAAAWIPVEKLIAKVKGQLETLLKQREPFGTVGS
jgi:hypothetical protein